MFLFSFSLSVLRSSLIKFSPPRKHQPRVTIDRLVITRESWSFAFEDLPFVIENQAAERFLSVRRWLATHRLPRFIFLKVPVEIKPYFVDFESPISIEAFVKLIRRTMEEDDT